MSKSSTFKTAFTPHYKRCLIENSGQGLFSGQWYNQGGSLTDDRITAAILGKFAVAYYASTSPKSFGIDIDDHSGRGEAYLADIYGKTIARFNGAPSIVAASPHGLHVWYFLEFPIPCQILETFVKNAVQGIPVEIRPTASLALRIPREASLLDPGTLLPINRDFETVIEAAAADRVFHPAELFGSEIMPQAVRLSLRERQKRFGALRHSTAIKKAQEEYLFLPGCTNDALNHLVPLYRAAGMDPDDTALQIAALLPPVYAGELRRYSRLLQRVKSYYRGAPDPKPHVPQQQLFTSTIADTIASKWEPYTQNKALDNTRLDDAHIRTSSRGMAAGNTEYRNSQVRASIRRLVCGILEWREFAVSLYDDNIERTKCNYLYPYFAKNIKEGYIPVPQSVLRRIDQNYSRHFDFLISIGFLERAPYKYVPGAGICHYYRINVNNFI